MTLATIKQKLADLKPELHTRWGVSEIGVFGSYVRGEQKRGSDIDLLVEFDKEVDLFDLLELQYFLEDVFGKKVDVALREELKPFIGKQILQEVEML